MSQKQDFILFKEHKKPDSSLLLEIELNNPKKLNVLNLEMIQSLNQAVRKWRNRRDLSAIFIHSAGERAFSAGGDVRQIYHKILKAEGADPALSVKEFFQTEYETDYILHQFPKPVVLWGNGIVMGGGMGLFMSASYPILTETSLLAMPEISIGFFPDVGASYFLNKNDGGRYMALTACQLTASEACFLNLAQWAFPHREKQNILDFLLGASFNTKQEFYNKFKDLQKKALILDKENCWIKSFQKEIEKAMKCQNLKNLRDYFLKAKKEDEKWEKNRQNFLKASPSSLAIILEQFKRAKNQKDLKALFEMEATIARHRARSLDFSEGVRALLIDKTKDPKWCPSKIEDLKPSEINKHFIAENSWDVSLKV